MKRVCHSGFDSIRLQGTCSFHPSLVKVVYSEFSDLFVEVVVFSAIFEEITIDSNTLYS